jgi:hypothetical protein
MQVGTEIIYIRDYVRAPNVAVHMHASSSVARINQ